jgi:hypothetical protein
MSGFLPAAAYETTQDALKPVAHGLNVQIVRVGSSIPIYMHLRSERLAPCIEWMHHLARILLRLVCYSGQAPSD